MTAIASALRAGGVTGLPISERSSSTCTTILRMLAGMVGSLSWCRASALAVPEADVGRLEPAHARMDAGAGAHREDIDDLVGQRRAGHAHLDGVEVAAHVGGIDVGHGDVQRGARRAHLLG